MLSIQRPTIAARPQFGRNLEASRQTRQQVFDFLESRAMEAAQTLVSNQEYDTNESCSSVATSGLLQAYATMAGYMLKTNKPGPMP